MLRLVCALLDSRWLVTLVVLGGSLLSADAAERSNAFLAAFNSINSTDSQQHVAVLANDTFEGREGGSRGGHAAGKYVVEHLTKAKLQPAGDARSYFQAFSQNHRNILAVLPGSDEKLRHEYVLIGAHYDHVGYGSAKNSYGPWGYIHNGADDNASGVSGLLEIVDAFMQMPQAPKRTILFAFWDAEEKGLLGSQHWATHPTLPLDRAHMCLNMDMIGRLRDERVEIYGIRTSRGLREFISRQNDDLGLRLVYSWKMKMDSDHYTFYQHRMPVIFLHTGLHEDYHRPADDVEKLSYPGIERVARLAFTLTHAFAEETQSRTFREASQQETPELQEQFESTQAQSTARLGIDWQPVETGGAVIVTRVHPGTPAATGDLRPADRITHVDGQAVRDPRDFPELLQIAERRAVFSVERAGEELALLRPVDLAGAPSRWGITWREDECEPNSVTVVRVLPGSAADKGGLKRGDRIERIQGRDLRLGDNLTSFMAELPSQVDVVVDRDGRHERLTLRSLKQPVR